MIRFTRLRLAGFKSFVDPTEIAIEAGMTGIVGPNGCGKSNLVEALRWVMGEASAKQMRGGEMEDVIFAGSARRPARQMAEVAVTLSSEDGAFPAPFESASEIEVARRIGRGDGSAYRVNGREIRARDVQTLFADMASGARSTAIVGQGHIGAIINARPSERRTLLEEAAGIAGLLPRRHEAELRLKAADANLERLEDVLGGLDERVQALKRQSRHAGRYRSLSQRIRDTRTALLRRRWADAVETAGQAAQRVSALLAEVERLAAGVAQAEAALAQARTALPSLRDARESAAATLSDLRQTLAQLDDQERRLARRRQEVAAQAAQASADLDRETARAADAGAALARLDGERRAIETAREGEAPAEAAADAAHRDANAGLGAAEALLAQAMERVAARDAGRGAALRRVSECEDRHRRLAARLAETETRLARCERVDPALLASAEMTMEEAGEHAGKMRDAVEAAEKRRARAQGGREACQETLRARRQSLGALQAEARGVEAALAGGAVSAHPGVVDALSTLPGFEAALGAALGDDLSAPLDAAAERAWKSLPRPAGGEGNDPPLPPEAVPLATKVTAPSALARRLAQTGLVDAAAAPALQAGLAVGQRLVSRDGGMWRWDGFTVAPGSSSAAAARLSQRARLRELAAMAGDASLGVDEALAADKAAEDEALAAAADEKAARDRGRQAEIELRQASEAHLKLARKAAEAEERLAALERQRAGAAAESAEAEALLAGARADLAAYPEDDGEERAELARLKALLAEKRSLVVEARAALDRLRGETAQRARRLVALAEEERSWQSMADAARTQMAELAARRDRSAQDLDRMAAEPARLAARRNGLAEGIGRAEARLAGALAALREAEAAHDGMEGALREAESLLARTREGLARREAEAEAAGHALAALKAELEGEMGQLPDAPAIEAARQGPAAAELAATQDRLTRERDAMGAVNLMAEAELEETEARIATLNAEKDDLVAGIAKLRGAIAEINKEGRERLRASFETVDREFRNLFTRLFGGGRAHLTLTDAEDPLQAGLEIMASPPGKRLQVLSLLSGGEQALTALSLLFAVFLSNPAPICVLDEVDAPLDDANVDRFCSLVQEMTMSSGTRFLVVTHHRMTMARMDRLYGVTMAERGVSTLVSVNLQRAAEFGGQLTLEV